MTHQQASVFSPLFRLTFSSLLLLLNGCEGCEAPCGPEPSEKGCPSDQICTDGRCQAAQPLPSDAGTPRSVPDAGEPASLDGGPSAMLDSGSPLSVDAGPSDAGLDVPPSDAGRVDAVPLDAGSAPFDAGFPEQSCTSSRDCTASEWICSELRDEDTAVTPYCARPTGAPGTKGAPCTTGIQCNTGLCVPRAQVCSVACVDAALDCQGAQACTAYPFGTQSGAFTFVGVCVDGCVHDDSCPSDRVCTYNGNPLTNRFDAICEVPLGAGDLGANCADDAECISGLCLTDGCSRVCQTNADCQAGTQSQPMRTCRDVLVGAPTGNGDATLRLCRQ